MGRWADVTAVCAGFTPHLEAEKLHHIIANSDKHRFALSDDTLRIRANQGHSITVDLGLSPQTPPETLFHGTSTSSLSAILKTGLLPGQRHHVHLSENTKTAYAVGQRHGKPVILTVAAGNMSRQGHVFFRSENGVWLTDAIPSEFLAPVP